MRVEELLSHRVSICSPESLSACNTYGAPVATLQRSIRRGKNGS